MKNLYFDINIASTQEFNPWPHSPTAKTVKLIRPNSRVLDVGCAKGYMARELAKKNCQVIGIEVDRSACNIARNFCQQVIEADIETPESLPFKNEFFDYIICLDVLEHLKRPDSLLQILKPYLSENGELIVSLPNIARFEHRINLFLGGFDYSEYGALNKEHLRFFTFKTAKKLIESSGYRIKRVESTGLGSMIKIFPTLLSFQFLFIAQRL